MAGENKLSPEQRFDALEKTVADLGSRLDQQAADAKAQLDGMESHNVKLDEHLAKMDQILATLSSSTPSAPAPAPSAPEKSELSVPTHPALTAEDIKAAVSEAMKGVITAEQLDEKLKEVQSTVLEVSKTKVPDTDDSVPASSKVGDESSGNKPEALTWEQTFEADRQVNPNGFKADNIPQSQLGVAALRSMKAKYGPKSEFGQNKDAAAIVTSSAPSTFKVVQI